MKLKNNNNNKKIIGDKRTHGSRNIPLFWNQKRYFKENVYHSIASACFLLLAVAVIIWIILASIYFKKQDNDMLSKPQFMAVAIISFIFLFTATISKINERKQRKIRVMDLSDAEHRKIEVLD